MDEHKGGEPPVKPVQEGHEQTPAVVYPDDPFTLQPEVAPSPPPAFAESSAGGDGSTKALTPPAAPPPPPPTAGDEGGDDDDGMLRMSFLEHLEELRGRIIKALWGF